MAAPQPWQGQAAGQHHHAIMAMADAVTNVAAMVAGYRRQLVNGGLSEPVAEQMALQLHESLMSHLRNLPGRPGPTEPKET